MRITSLNKVFFCLGTLVGILCSLNSHASNFDVLCSGRSYIKVSIQGDEHKFELCMKAQIEGERENCTLITNRSYPLQQLKLIQRAAKKRAWMKNGLAGTLVVASGAAGVMVLGPMGVMPGVVTATFFISLVTSYNPVVQARIDQSLNDEVIEDRDLMLSGGDEEIELFAKDLEFALQELPAPSRSAPEL